MKISKLHISLKDKILVDISFSISSSLALVGQSGSGKSLTLKALLGMLPSSMECIIETDADFELKGGKDISFVPQNPFTALSPLTKIKKQFFVSESRIKELFAQVDLDESLFDRFAPELSGGQLQRVVIAMALEREPQLILLDEPTTALDPKNRNLILDLLRELQKKHRFKMLFVTHDMNSAKMICDEICVIKDGIVVENSDMKTLLASPQQAYTKTLIDANFANRDFRR